MKANVLGTYYTVEYRKEADDKGLVDVDGYTDENIKLIVVKDFSDEKVNPRRCERLDIYQQEILRHELIHAFIEESGLGACTPYKWALNEEMTDWMAKQFPKMALAMFSVGALEGGKTRCSLS